MISFVCVNFKYFVSFNDISLFYWMNFRIDWFIWSTSYFSTIYLLRFYDNIWTLCSYSIIEVSVCSWIMINFISIFINCVNYSISVASFKFSIIRNRLVITSINIASVLLSVGIWYIWNITTISCNGSVWFSNNSRRICIIDASKWFSFNSNTINYTVVLSCCNWSVLFSWINLSNIVIRINVSLLGLNVGTRICLIIV